MIDDETSPATASSGSDSETARRQEQQEGGTNIKETIESILVAFILAFIFRAFVVEAFVIPTGSMATTLLGAHMRYQCPDCGYTFDLNYQAPTQAEGDAMLIPSEARPSADVYCPNCGYRVASHTEPQPVRYGDRILVMKYVYLLHDPNRWDVVVFKAPDEPKQYHYTQNFIKRLVGKPGESLMVLDGDVYVKTVADPNWRVQTKPRAAQEALWRLVYDNDAYPQQLPRDGQAPWTQPWRPVAGSGWNLGTDAATGRTFHFDNSTDSGALEFDPNANSTTQTLTDYLAYDIGTLFRRPGGNGSRDDEQANPVSDLKLVTYYHRTAGDGPFRLKLSRHESVDHLFTAEFTTDSVKLLHRTNTGEHQVGSTVRLADLGIKPGDPIFIEFQNVDYQITLRLNGRDVLQTTPAEYAPNVPWLTAQWVNRRHGKMPQAEIEAENQTCSVDHVSLWRDIYYTNRETHYGDSFAGDAFTWASPTTPVTLGPAEYFVLGDNSAVSKDARYWNEPINLPHEDLDVQSGRVPAQFLLGQAVYVYWPAGFRAFDTHLSIIPDFGDMRWIH